MIDKIIVKGCFFLWIFKNVFRFKWLFITTLLRKKQIYLCSNFFQATMLLLPWVIQSMFSLGDIIFSISTTNPQSSPKCPLTIIQNTLFWSTHFLASFFLFAFEIEQTSYLPETTGAWIHSLYWLTLSSSQTYTVPGKIAFFVCCCLTNFNRETNVLLPGRVTIQAGNES